MDSGTASQVRPCRMTAGYSCDAFLNGTSTLVAFQGMLEAKSQLIEVPGEKLIVKAMIELVSMRCPILSVVRLAANEVVVVMENERRYKSYKKNRQMPLHKYYGVYDDHESELSESCPLEDPSNVDEPPAVTVRETTMSWTRRFEHKYAEDERMLQSVRVTAIPDLSTSVFVWAGDIGILDSWDHREVINKCVQEQSLKSLAELFREQRPRSRMVENTHCDMEGLARARRSDPIERTGASVDGKSLLTSWLVRKRVWSSTGVVMVFAGLSDFKRQCGKDYVGESLNKANCCRVSVRIQSEMESRWKADGVFMGKLDLSDEVTVGVEQMRIADDIVCYSTAISDCVKELNSLMALTSRKQTSAACLKTRLCSIQRSVHVIKACFGP